MEPILYRVGWSTRGVDLPEGVRRRRIGPRTGRRLSGCMDRRPHIRPGGLFP